MASGDTVQGIKGDPEGVARWPFATAAAGPSMGISPTPLAPCGPNGDRVPRSRWSRALAGIGKRRHDAIGHIGGLATRPPSVDDVFRAEPTPALAGFRPRSGPRTIDGMNRLADVDRVNAALDDDLVGVQVHLDVDEARRPAVAPDRPSRCRSRRPTRCPGGGRY